MLRTSSAAATHELVQRALLGDALDAGPVLVFVADERMRYLAINQTACDVLGYPREELLALTVTDVAVADEAPELYRALLHRRAGEGATKIRRKDGTLLPFRYRAAEVTVARMTVYVSIGYVEVER